MDWNIEVLDRNRKRIAVLEKAYNVSYVKEKDKLYTARFTLPIGDDKNKHCMPFNYVKLYENGVYVDMFRILPLMMTKDSKTSEVTYSCEHVLGKLLDTCLFQYHEIGGVGTYTETVLRYLLSKQKDWVLGKCDFRRQFQYGWENENLLSALLSIPRSFSEDYQFTWDTTVFPWVLNLIRPADEIKAYFRYNRNLSGIKKKEDGTVVCTRLYPLGYGEGINQLGISRVNPTKLPYIEADTIDQYGIIEKIWPDRRYQIEDNLFTAAKAKLEKIKRPRVTYEIQGLELFALTGIPVDKFDMGDVVRVIDEESGIDETTRIVKKSKDGIERDHISVTVEISSDGGNSRAGLMDISERAIINDTYPQGATNVNNHNYNGNCDPQHPAKIRFRLSDKAVNINEVMLSFEADNFRAYSRAIKGGGDVATSTSNGGSSQQSSSDGGAVTASTTDGGAHTPTSSSGGGTTASTENGGGDFTSTESGGGQTSGPSSLITTQLDGGVLQTTGFFSVIDIEVRRDALFKVNSLVMETSTHPTLPTPNPPHTHDVYPHGHPHSHDVNLPNHNHGMAHTHNIQAHQHSLNIRAHRHSITISSHQHTVSIPAHNHSVTIPSHQHTVSIPAHNHNVTIPAHVHEIEYGIYSGPRASNFTVIVDGKLTTINRIGNDIDIVPYLNKMDDGTIVRGWHEVLIYPDDLCLINADVMVQVFVNSRGGGNY